jgi:hypothetical protein
MANEPDPDNVLAVKNFVSRAAYRPVLRGAGWQFESTDIANGARKVAADSYTSIRQIPPVLVGQIAHALKLRVNKTEKIIFREW